jgi:prepilin-type processing-associated H-X9-DG protein
VDNWATGAQVNQPWRVDNPLQRPQTQLILESYLCPSNALPKKDDDQYGTSHYVGCAGVRPHIALNNAGYTYACANFKGRNHWGILAFANDNRNTWCWGMQDVVDGTSNTFLVGEVGKSTGLIEPTIINHGNFPIWAGGNNDQGCNTQFMGSHLRFCDDIHFLNRRDNTIQSTLSFGSYHPGGAQFVLADGSVRFIPTTVNLLVYRFLGDRRDEQPVTLP